MVIMLLPVLIIIFVMGWCMYCMGDQKRRDKIQCKPPKKDNVSLMPIVFEENQEIINT